MLKIALLSDIHSNVFALDAVIKDIKKRGVDITVNLGDILFGPIAPKETFELLHEHDFLLFVVIRTDKYTKQPKRKLMQILPCNLFLRI
jgi:predicted phosphodiesterase